MSKQHRRRLAQSHAAKALPPLLRSSRTPESSDALRESQPQLFADDSRSSRPSHSDPIERAPATYTAPTHNLARKQCPTCGERYPADFRVCPRDAAELLDASNKNDDPLLGTVLGDTYHVLRVIGEGGMGRVYEARHTRLFSKHYAIKVLHGDLTRQPEVVGRFLREAEATSALCHPNIVGVIDVNQVPDGRPYIVAELLKGDQLGDYLQRKGKLSVDESVAICRPICQALQAAHSKHIVHRDIKPENLYLVGEGAQRTVKVLDFGISRVGGASAQLTKTGMIMGTPAYMPPEQARGARVDHRADIYAVGAILYEAVTGEQPFDDSDPVSTLAAVLTLDPPRPCSLDATIPPGLELVIQKAMAKKPEQRYRTMRELDAALAEFDRPPPTAASETFESAGATATTPALNISDRRRSQPTQVLQTQLQRFWRSEVPAPEQARAKLLGVSIGAACYALAGLIDVSTSVVRWSRDGAPLTSAEIVLATLGSLGLLIAPGLAWCKFVINHVWQNTPRTIDILERSKRVLATSLVTYAIGMLSVRVFDGAFHTEPSGVAWPGWGVITFVCAAIAAGAATWRTLRSQAERQLVNVAP